jgi:hypothetical protein
MEHNLPVDVNVPLQIKAFGDKTTFRELYLNPFHKTENILQSAARILADSQNKEVIGKIITADYTAAAFNQPADTTGATADLKIYNTVKKAIKKALMLYNTPTGKRIGEMQHEIYLLINPLDLYDVEPVINGGLERLAGINQMVGRLPFNGVIPYAGGINDGLKWGNETLSFPGVPLGKFFILIKNPVYGGYKVIKRSPSMEMGNGDVLALTTEKRAWHRIDGVFLDWLLPGGTPQKPAGAVISGTFPAAA